MALVLLEPVVDDNHVGAEAGGLIRRGKTPGGGPHHPKTRFAVKNVFDKAL